MTYNCIVRVRGTKRPLVGAQAPCPSSTEDGNGYGIVQSLSWLIFAVWRATRVHILKAAAEPPPLLELN